MTAIPRRLLVASLLSALAALPSRAAEAAAPAENPPVLSLDAALKNFAAPALSRERSAGDSDVTITAGAALGEWRNTQSQLANLQSYFDNNDYASALRQARQYARQAATAEVRQRWNDLIAALEAEQKKAEAAVAEKVGSALSRASESLLAARKPADLDPLMEQLSALQENRGYSNSTPRFQRLHNRLSNAVSFVQQWQDLLATYAEGDLDTTRQTIRNLASGGSRDRLLSRSQILGFAATLKLDQATVEAAFARIDPVMKEAADTALAAKKASALDPVLARLEELKDDYRNNYDSPVRRAHDRVENAINFFRQWQDFLSAYEHGDERDARQQLRNIASNSYRYRPIARAVILDRAAKLVDEFGSESDTLVADLTWQTLATVRARVSEAQEQAYGRRSTELARIVSELDRLSAARAALDSGKAGLGRAALRSGPTTTGSSCAANVTNLPLPAAVSALRESWWFDAAPALTGLADLPPRKDGESVADYAGRQLDAALASADWSRAHRFALLQRDVLPSEVAPCGNREKAVGANAAAALGSYLKAQKFERALQFEAAAAAYRDALGAGAPPALEEALIKRLRELATDPAASFKAAGSE